MTDLAIKVRGLRKVYAGRAAVDGADLDVAPGECVALLGPNGAGKTTTVEILEGYRQRDAGNAELTAAETVHHFARYYPNPKDPDQVLAAVGLADKRDTRTRALSGGQRRRLDVALGIVGRPELLFLDEPTTGFDPEARRQFWDLLDGLRTDGTTILLTTHYLDEAERLADRVAVIADGRIVASGDPVTLGGRASAAATVSWLAPEGPRSVQTAGPTQVVMELATRFGGEVPELAVRRPTLEDVYLELVDGIAAEQ